MYPLCKNLFRLTWKNVGSYLLVFTVAVFKYCLQKSVAYHREDVYDLFPGVFATVEMIPDSVGVWLLHCHVNDHMTGGMEALFTVDG